MNQPLNPFELMAAWWQTWAGLQKSWFGLWQQALPGMGAWPAVAGMPMPVSGLETLMGGMMPRVSATVTPLETSGPLAGADEAARLSLRMALPGCLGPAEMLMVEAVVARARADEAPGLPEIDALLLPQPSRD